MVRLSIFVLLLTLIAGPAWSQTGTPRTSSGCSRARSSCSRPATLLGAIDTYKAALAIIPDRADALSNLGAAYVRLGQFDDAIAQYEAALKSDPTNKPIRLNLALAYYKSARPNQAIPQLKRDRRLRARGQERVSRAGRLLPADRAGPGAHRAAEAARADVRRRPRLRVSARHGAAAHGRRRRGAEVRRSGIRRRRVGRSAPAAGHRAPRPAGLSGGQDRSSSGP